MTFNKHIHHRQSIRLRNYDYSQGGMYFITICTHNKFPLFGNVENENMMLNDIGIIAHEEWQKINAMRPNITLDAFVVMPNHVHGVIVLCDARHNNSGVMNHAPTEDGCVGAQFIAPQSPGIVPIKLGEIVRAYKARCTHAIHEIPGMESTPIWQRNYYERIIRNENELAAVREYIINNPLQWALDEMYVL